MSYQLYNFLDNIHVLKKSLEGKKLKIQGKTQNLMEKIQQFSFRNDSKKLTKWEVTTFQPSPILNLNNKQKHAFRSWKANPSYKQNQLKYVEPKTQETPLMVTQKIQLVELQEIGPN